MSKDNNTRNGCKDVFHAFLVKNANYDGQLGIPCVKQLCERKYFKAGVDYAVDRLKPKAIVVYGSTPDEVLEQYKAEGIEILQFDSEFMQSRKAVND